MDEMKQPRRGIQSVEIAFRILSVLQTSQQAMALKDIAPLAGLTASAANNYLVSLVRTGLAAADDKPGCYRLGPAALSLGLSAIQQIDGFEIVRREVTMLRDATRRSAAVTTWSDDGPISLFKQDGDQRGAFEFRTGLIPMLTSAAGKIYAARLPASLTTHLIDREWSSVFGGKPDARKFSEDARRELKRKGYTTIVRPTWLCLDCSAGRGLERRCPLYPEPGRHPGLDEHRAHERTGENAARQRVPRNPCTWRKDRRQKLKPDGACSSPGSLPRKRLLTSQRFDGLPCRACRRRRSAGAARA
jgi:DNA-binding IclR family transcriptional regulator